jgi:hypothetical protein
MIVKNLKSIQSDFDDGRNIFRRPSVQILLDEINRQQEEIETLSKDRYAENCKNSQLLEQIKDANEIILDLVIENCMSARGNNISTYDPYYFKKLDYLEKIGYVKKVQKFTWKVLVREIEE